ncbi:DUF465 domain-containing protein [Reyranella sp. CPCC 100927]|uniref:DUF465 domain-containing protein n=1 Tax=Reyranella sp. CPCC 100927 TaxID=2599616 RepID=UPI0011B5D311|nr:DUF465 domain-containing protein [Reyranella sp. CPCC 100927]TWS96811.1 DUF465 domain-containing protein [Reyranella sp. CPCC 100927]
MSLMDRIETLKSRHAALEQAIHDEVTRPHPDDEVLQELKKKKLRLKDEIAELASH